MFIPLKILENIEEILDFSFFQLSYVMVSELKGHQYFCNLLG